MKTIILIIHAFRDLFIRYLPNFKKNRYAFAFLIHPRDIKDTYRKYPFFKLFPEKFLLWFLKHYWPVYLSKIEGLKSQKTGEIIFGYIIAISLTAYQMLENRELGRKKIIQAIKLAEKMGVKIIGLGALTSSITKGGLDLIDKVNIGITTGHAYTAYTVISNLFKLIKLFNFDKDKVLIAIVGAAGSIGSASAQIIARAQFNNLLLIDVERKAYFIKDLIPKLKKINKKIDIEISYQISSIKKADLIITATNTPEAIIKSGDLKSGAIIIDDAQPSDISPDVLERNDVLVIEGGLIHTPAIINNFNFSFRDKFDNYCCLGEVMALASQEWNKHYVINRANLDLVDEISLIANKLGFKPAEFQNFKEIISENKLSLIKNIIQNKKDGI